MSVRSSVCLKRYRTIVIIRLLFKILKLLYTNQYPVYSFFKCVGLLVMLSKRICECIFITGTYFLRMIWNIFITNIPCLQLIWIQCISWRKKKIYETFTFLYAYKKDTWSHFESIHNINPYFDHISNNILSCPFVRHIS